MRTYLEIDEIRHDALDTTRSPFVVEPDRGEVRLSVHESRVEGDEERFDANWATIVAQDRFTPEQPRYILFTKVIREAQEPYGLRVVTENPCFPIEAITTEIAVASRLGLGGTA
jgi:hypothetical protein